MIRNLTHISDIDDLSRELRDMLPVRLQFEKDRPIAGTEKEQLLALNRYFHGGVVKTFSEKSGFTLKEAKEELQKMFCLISDVGEVIEVESTSGMSLERIRSLVLQCNVFLSETFGEVVEPPFLGQTKIL